MESAGGSPSRERADRRSVPETGSEGARYAGRMGHRDEWRRAADAQPPERAASARGPAAVAGALAGAITIDITVLAVPGRATPFDVGWFAGFVALVLGVGVRCVVGRANRRVAALAVVVAATVAFVLPRPVGAAWFAAGGGLLGLALAIACVAAGAAASLLHDAL